MITSVAQIPIESIIFPPVTICPLKTGDSSEETHDKTQGNWTVDDLVKSCNYTKDEKHTKGICDRIQVC